MNKNHEAFFKTAVGLQLEAVLRQPYHCQATFC